MSYLGGIKEGTVSVGAGVQAPIGIGAMEGGVMTEGMMTMITIMIAQEEGTGAEVLAIGEVGFGVGVLIEEGSEVGVGKIVKRGVPKLSDGTRKEKNKKKMLPKGPFPTATIKTMIKEMLLVIIMVEIIVPIRISNSCLNIMACMGSRVYYKETGSFPSLPLIIYPCVTLNTLGSVSTKDNQVTVIHWRAISCFFY